MTTEEIKKFIEELLAKMSVAVERVDVAESGGRTRFAIRSGDSQILIGAKGAHLFALNHLVKKVASKGGDREQPFYVDVNDYHAASLENLQNLAAIMGGRARSFKTDIELEPMSSYERMIVHSFFQDAPDLKTESVGEGEKRRVVIKYVEPAGN